MKILFETLLIKNPVFIFITTIRRTVSVFATSIENFFNIDEQITSFLGQRTFLFLYSTSSILSVKLLSLRTFIWSGLARTFFEKEFEEPI